ERTADKASAGSRNGHPLGERASGHDISPCVLSVEVGRLELPAAAMFEAAVRRGEIERVAVERAAVVGTEQEVGDASAAAVAEAVTAKERVEDPFAGPVAAAREGDFD